MLGETEILTKKDKQIHTDGQQELEEVDKHGVREKGIERKEREIERNKFHLKMRFSLPESLLGAMTEYQND